SAEKGGVERGKDYNHSTFNDIIITGLVGLRPDVGHRVVNVHPLVPPGALDYFCLDDVDYAGHRLAILLDANGLLYHKGKGFRVYVDGREKLHRTSLAPVSVTLED